ncbi:MAG: hypothetical protein A2046_14935, partial [Bacteroidetes bacterium GWA2_30_7]
MKNFTKQILTSSIFLLFVSFVVYGQTNVSGGIYSNTTWTLANSPYIVVDTVVVFPGVTLTIEPGVVVKFDDNKRLEIRQAKIIAEGTTNDSITFTSNSLSPIPGKWATIYLNNAIKLSKFNYCYFKYANWGIYADYASNSSDTVIIKNSNFYYNKEGIHSYWFPLKIDSCNFIYNTNYGVYGFTSTFLNYCFISNNNTGVYFAHYNKIMNSIIDSNTIKGIYLWYYHDTIVNCQIRNNGIGIYDSIYDNNNFIYRNIIENNFIGIKLKGSQENISCNKICNNTFYDLYSNVVSGSNCIVENNYWCTIDSISTTTRIYDGYDNINLGLISFMPLDTLQCYLATQIPISEFQNFSISIFPNPASENLTISLQTNISKTEIKIFNILGEIEYFSIVTNQKSIIDV